MLKKLLYLYNDGHNPFPKLGEGGLGYKPHMIGGMVNPEEKEETHQQEEKEQEPEKTPEEIDDEFVSACAEWKNVKKQFEKDTVANQMFKEDWLNNAIYYFTGHREQQEWFKRAYDRYKQPGQPEIDLDDYDVEKFYKENFEWHEAHMPEYHSDEEEEEGALEVDFAVLKEELKPLSIKGKIEILMKISDKLIDESKTLQVEMSKLKAFQSKLEPIIKTEITKYVEPYIKREVDVKIITELAKATELISKPVNSKNSRNPEIIAHGNELIKGKTKQELLQLYGFINWYAETKKQSSLENTKNEFVQTLIMEKIYPKYTKAIDEYAILKKQRDRVLDDLQEVGRISQETEKLRSKEQKEVKKKIDEGLEQEKEVRKKAVKQTREEKLAEEIKLKEQQRKQQAEDEKLLGLLGAEEPKTKSKSKAKKEPKPVPKSEEEKQHDLLHADVVGRLDTIDKTLSSNGKDLEKYLSNQGQTILQYMTGDKSKVYDNEFNPAIPDVKVLLNTGKEESLRHAVTLDLFNEDNIYEIKNYKQYSIKDKVIPIQETKLSGTGYFIPLYLDNGKLYNIELNYTDPESGVKKSKFILPENPNGRELNLVYRLSDGIYEFKPLAEKTNYVALQPSPLKTKDGKQLYIFKNTTFKHCKDHHGNPAFNIAPYLKKIKI